MAEHTEYVLEPLRKRAEFTLCRGKERANQMPILALVVAEQPSPQSLRRLQREYSLATQLDSAWAAQTMIARRAQYHQQILVGHITPDSPAYRSAFHAMSSKIAHSG